MNIRILTVIVLGLSLTGCGTMTTRRGLISPARPYRCSDGPQLRYVLNNYDQVPLEEALSNTGILSRDYSREYLTTNQLVITSITKEHDSRYDFFESLPFLLCGLSWGLIPAKSYVSVKTEISVEYGKRVARYTYADEISRWTSVWHHLAGGRSYFDYQAINEEKESVLESIRRDVAYSFVRDMVKDGMLPPCKESGTQ